MFVCVTLMFVCVYMCLCVSACLDSLYQLLMELSSSSVVRESSVSRGGMEAECGSVSSLACCCLLSLVIARGETGKILTTLAAMLMYSTRLAAQHIMVPDSAATLNCL